MWFKEGYVRLESVFWDWFAHDRSEDFWQFHIDGYEDPSQKRLADNLWHHRLWGASYQVIKEEFFLKNVRRAPMGCDDMFDRDYIGMSGDERPSLVKYLDRIEFRKSFSTATAV